MNIGLTRLFPSQALEANGITADTFAKTFVGQNYGWVFLAYGVGGILGPILGGRLGDMGNSPPAFTIVGVLCLVAALIIATVQPPLKTADSRQTDAGGGGPYPWSDD